MALLGAAGLSARPLDAGPARASGTLVLVGGGLSPANTPVWRAFLDARPADRPLVAIVAAGSAEPATAGRRAAEQFIAQGVAPADVVVLPVALVDDPATPDVDEAGWADGARDAEVLAMLERAGAIWFTGGDQARIARLFLEPSGEPTPALSLIRRRLAHGAVVGGSSAGAGVMAHPMLARGDSFGAAFAAVERDAVGHSAPDGGAVALAPGLGLLGGVVLDQHFDRRGRLVRLVRALEAVPRAARVGLGIDEDTALVLSMAQRVGRVVGQGHVTLIDARRARLAFQPAQGFEADGVRLGLASAGDAVDLATMLVSPGPGKTLTAGREQRRVPPLDGGGLAIPNDTLAETIGADLVDNRDARRVERWSVSGGRGLVLALSRDEASSGWWAPASDTQARYGADGIRLDIRPARVRLERQGRPLPGVGG